MYFGNFFVIRGSHNWWDGWVLCLSFFNTESIKVNNAIKYSTSHESHKVVMHPAEPYSTREATERLVKITDSTYAKADL